MAGRGFEINKQGIERFTRELQKEFDKHPIRVDVRTGLPELPDISHGATVTYNGPVIFGSADGAQLAWNNGAVSQSQTGESQQIAEGFEALANVVAEILRQLPATGLDDEDQALAAEAGNEILAQLIQPSPEPGKIKRAAATLRGSPGATCHRSGDRSHAGRHRVGKGSCRAPEHADQLTRAHAGRQATVGIPLGTRFSD